MASKAAVAPDRARTKERERQPHREKTVMVSARIPASLHGKVNDILKRRGITQTELILAAYDYVSATYELPARPEQPVRGKHVRDPTPEEIEAFKTLMRSIVGNATPEHEDWDDGRLKFEAMKERYPDYLGNVEYEESR